MKGFNFLKNPKRSSNCKGSRVQRDLATLQPQLLVFRMGPVGPRHGHIHSTSVDNTIGRICLLKPSLASPCINSFVGLTKL